MGLFFLAQSSEEVRELADVVDEVIRCSAGSVEVAWPELCRNIDLHPAVMDFQRLIASDPVVGMYVSRMIAQVPETRSLAGTNSAI